MLVPAGIDFSVARSSLPPHWLPLFSGCYFSFFFFFCNKDLSFVFHFNSLMRGEAASKALSVLDGASGTLSFVTLSLKSGRESLLLALLLPDLVDFILKAASSPASSPS